MIAHASVTVSDYDKAKDFYTKTLAPLGYTLTSPMDEYKAAGFKDAKADRTDFWIGHKTPVVGGHVAFEVKSKEEVEAFYKAGLEAGGTDNGTPGYRTDYWPGYYAAYIHDIDGNNIEAVWYDYSKVA